MLKKLTRGSLKVGFKMVVGLYVHLIMTVIYALATLIGGGNGLKAVKTHKKAVHTSILGVTGGCIGVKLFLAIKNLYVTCETYGYVWLYELITVKFALNIIMLGTLIYFVTNLIKAYANRLEDNSNRLLISIIELISFVVITLVMMFNYVPNKFYYLLGLYPVIKWVLKNRLQAVIDTVVENTEEVVDVDEIRENLMRRMNKITDKVSDTISTIQKNDDEIADVTENEPQVVSNDVSWDELGIVTTTIEQQITSENLASTVEIEKPVVLEKTDMSVLADSVVTVAPTEKEHKKDGGKKLNLKMIKNVGNQKAPERRVRTEQLNESMTDLLADGE